MVDGIVPATVDGDDAAVELVVPGAEDGDGMQCSEHPYKNNSSPGGVCAFCLQEKLGKLVSSSFSVIGSSSFRSYVPSAAPTTSNGGYTTIPHSRYNPIIQCKVNSSSSPFLLTQNKKKTTSNSYDVVLKRNKSSAFGPRPRGGFWGFFHLSLGSQKKLVERPNAGPNTGPTMSNGGKEGENEGSNNIERKVSRSRSVGCGSRSFSGDFFERLSTGFGDCTLRRVESHREPRRSTSAARDAMKERVRCRGLFGGFSMTSSSSSSSSSSHWVDEEPNVGGPMANGRSRSWGRAFASPMRAFSKGSNVTTATSKKGNGASKNTTTAPNLNDIPSLLAARG